MPRSFPHPLFPLAPGDDVFWPDPRNSLIQLMATLREGLGGAPGGHLPLTEGLSIEEVRRHRQVVLLVLDGAGLSALERLPADGFLRRGLRCSLSSVFPSTTASAVTTLLTGLSPAEHGLVGWHVYFRELGAILAVLPGRPRCGRGDWSQTGLDLERLLGLVPFTEGIPVPSTLTQPRAIADSPFSRALRGRALGVAHSGLEEALLGLAERMRSIQGRAYHLVYDAAFDHLAHETGVSSPKAYALLVRQQSAVKTFLDRLSGTNTLVLVTADHGFVDLDPSKAYDLAAYPDVRDSLVLPLSGEARAAFAHVRAGDRARFEHAVEVAFGAGVRLYRSPDLVEAGVFGAGICHPGLRDRIGDYTLIPSGRGVIREALFGDAEPRMIGVHGGVSREEMQVPLLVYSG